MNVWHIDSLDGRAGLAFATEFTKAGDGLEAKGLRTYFISAPNFVPEPVSDRAIALAASNGSYQSGFYLDEKPVPFAVLADIVELVRRLHTAGEIEEEPPEGGRAAEPLIRPEGGPGGGELAEAEAEVLHGAFNAIINNMPEQLGTAGQECDWKLLRDIAKKPGFVEMSCLRALLILLHDLLAMRSFEQPKEWVMWCKSVELWMTYLNRVGLEVELRRHLNNNPLYHDSLKDGLVRAMNGTHLGEVLEILSEVHDLGVVDMISQASIALRNGSTHMRDIEEWYHRFGRRYPFRALRFNGQYRDESLFESLWDIRVPKYSIVGMGLRDDASLGQLITLAMSSIACVQAADEAVKRDIYDFLIFVAILLHSKTPMSYAGPFYHFGRGAEARYGTLQWADHWSETIDQAMNWLAKQLPQRVLPAQIEQTIAYAIPVVERAQG